MTAGIILQDLANPIAGAAITAANALAQSGSGSPVLFYENASTPNVPIWVPAFHVSAIWGYHQSVIATGLSTARRALASQTLPLRILYLWDAEWVRPIGRWFRPLWTVYTNPNLVIVPASRELAGAFERAWSRKPKRVVNEFNVVEILNAAKES